MSDPPFPPDRGGTPPAFPPEPARRARRQIAGLLVLAFLAGAAADHAVTGLIGRAFGFGPHRQPPHGPGPGPDGGGGPDRMIERLSRELSLDAATEQRVRAIFDAHRPRVEEVFLHFRPEMEKVRDDTHAEVRAALPPEKREAFDRFVASNHPPGEGMPHPGDRPPPPRGPGREGPPPPPRAPGD